MTCPHDITERDAAATADGLCPLCLQTETRAAVKGLVEAIAENERLRAALKQIVNGEGESWIYQRIAREALSGKSVENAAQGEKAE
jgi:hypothetical protein